MLEVEERGQVIHLGARFAVYRAPDERGAAVIAKTPRERRERDAVAALRHEYDVLVGLQADGVSRPLALQEEPGGPMLVFEDAGPLDLARYLGGSPVGLDRFFPLAIQVADALAAVHEKSVIHREVCPSNVVVGADDVTATLVDFDLSTTMAETANAAELAAFAGSLPYLSPEQTGLVDRLVDERSDLYSLGATLYELLTGAPPFPRASARELIHRQLAEVPVAPSTVNPAVPPAVGDIVLKLLRKTPEERYRFAASAAVDLRYAAKRWHADRWVHPFELATEDLARELPLPDAMYGRDRDTAELNRALSRIAAGESEVHLLTGPPGAGKTRLAESLRTEVENRGGVFLAGAFAAEHNRPHAAFIDALSAAVRDLARLGEDERAEARAQIERAIGDHAELLTDIIPELAELIGHRPAPARLGPAESKGRCHFAFQALAAGVSAGRPVVLFLDNLDEAGPASLSLLESLLTGPGQRRWLVVGALRSSPGPEHEAALAAIGARGVAVRAREVAGLGRDAVAELVTDALRVPLERARELAEILVRKTGGNPLFVRELLRSLHRQGLLMFREHGAWTWDIEAIRRADVTDNVAALMADGIGELPVKTREALQIGSCLGRTFFLDRLAVIRDEPAEHVALILSPALRAGLIVARAEPPRRPRGAYRFIHDRVREAAYSMMKEKARSAVHNRIARRLLAELSARELEDELFEVVDQVNLGSNSISNEEELLRAANLNLRAGAKARATSFAAAARYLLCGVGLCRARWWTRHHGLVFRLHRDAAECLYLTGEVDRADALADAALSRAQSRAEQAELAVVRTSGASARGDWAQAIEWGREGLRRLGEEIPSVGDQSAAWAEEATVRRRLGRRRPIELLKLPRMQDPDTRARMKLLSALLPSAFFTGEVFLRWVIVRMVRLSMEHGTASESPEAFASYGALLVTAGETEVGAAFGKLGVELATASGDPQSECRTLQLVGMHLNHWAAPLKTNIPILERAIRAGERSGSAVFASFAHISLVATLHSASTPLPRVLEEIERGVAFGRRAHLDVETFTPFRQAIRCLRGNTVPWRSFDTPEFREKDFLSRARANQTAIALYGVLRAQSAYLFGDENTALAMARLAETRLEHVRGLAIVADYHLYAALARAASAPDETADAESFDGDMEAHERALDAFAAHCEENFRAKQLLVAGVRARVAGRHLEAAARFEEAIAAAARGELVHEEALANELAGSLYHELGLPESARRCLRAAASRYARWGAAAKAQALTERLPQHGQDDPALMSSRGGLAQEDLLTILEASSALADAVDTDRLIDRLMRVCVEAAGAERGVLFLLEGEELFARAAGTAAAPPVRMHTPVAETEEAPRSIVEAARVTGRARVVHDARADAEVRADPYVRDHGLRAALAVPLLRRGTLAGVFYFENNLTTFAFPPARVRVVEVLASQAANALEIGTLVERLNAEIEDRSRAESMVKFLADASAAFAASLDYAVTLRRVVDEIVPGFADFCYVDLVDEEGVLKRVAAAHADPDKSPLLRELERHELAEHGPPLLARVVQRGDPTVVPDVSEDQLAAETASDEHAEVIRQLGGRSFMAVPLTDDGRIRGRVCFALATRGRSYTRSDLSFAVDLARRASVAIENARLYGEAQRAIQIRDEFLAIASHELKTPLTSMKLAMQGVSSGTLPRTPENVSRAFAVAERQLSRLTRLVDELLNVARLKSGQIDLRLEVIDLRDVVAEALERLADDAAQYGTSVHVRADEPVRGHWDRSSLDRVVTNLLSNAFKFGAGQPVEIVVESDEDGARLEVCDRGIGISPEQHARIFERFARGVSSSEYGGLGLGLYIVQRIVDALGGELRVESAAGEGARFIVVLPRRPPAEGRLRAEARRVGGRIPP